jgi:hypothetical protein
MRALWLAPVLWALAVPFLASPADFTLTRARFESFAPDSSSHGFGHRLLLWIPNRLFDVLDVVRLRVRAGPGISASVRATEAADVALGGHATVFAGLPGPRGVRRIPWPVGLETYAGLEVSLADLGTEDDRHGPRYAPLEAGLGAQLGLVGLDVGVDPFDAVDLVAGILFLDPRGDDF